MCGIRGERKGERAVRMFPLWKAVCAWGMACSSVSAEQGLAAACSLHWTAFSVPRNEKSKVKSWTLRQSSKVKEWVSLHDTFIPSHRLCMPDFLFLWFSVLGLHVFCSRWVSKSFTTSVKYAIMLLNVLNVPKHGQGFAKQAWFGQRSFHFWGLERSISCSYLSVILSAWRMSLQPDTKHACRVCCYKQEIIKACKSASSLPLLELLGFIPYTLFTF